MRYYTTKEAGLIIQESADQVRRRCATKQIRAKRLGNSWRISEDALTEFMAGPPTRSPRKRLTKRQLEQLERTS